jgi:hypothetical protein
MPFQNSKSQKFLIDYLILILELNKFANLLKQLNNNFKHNVV